MHKSNQINIQIIEWSRDSHLPKILLTQPLETCRIREISQGLAPEWANSTIFCRVESGSGRPLT